MPLDDTPPPPAGSVQPLHERYGHLRDETLLDAIVHEAFPGRIAVASSFGIESAVLLRLVAAVAPEMPVLFLNTGMLFAQTEQYQRHLTETLGLTDVRVIRPAPDHLAEYDPDNTLHRHDANLCCHLRKVLPMQKALSPFEAWITGRKRFQGGERTALPLIEHDGRQFKINPLADWDEARVRAAFDDSALPHHPLEEAGYASVGCYPCTSFALDGGSARSGRWAGSDKTECGIHNAPWAGGGI